MLRSTLESSWKPEYARYMVEGTMDHVKVASKYISSVATPGLPYGATLDDLLVVQDNMLKR